LILNKLHITNYKNHKEISFEPDTKWNCITGLNGTGKTNLLEVIYFLCILKGFSSGVDDNKIRHGERFFRLSGQFCIGDEEHKMLIKYLHPGKKEVQRNNLRIKKLSEHVGRFPVLLVQPIDDYRLMEGSHARRRLLDHSLAQSFRPYLHALSTYNKMLKQRNAMLKQARGGTRPEPQLFDYYSDNMNEHAQKIMSYREMLIQDIESDVQRLYGIISSDREAPSIFYNPNLQDTTLSASFKKNRELDFITGRTNSGPHKDDLVLSLNDKLLKDGSSQGQRKSFLLAFKLAVYLFIAGHSGQLPILLLDDLFDKLDNQRVQNLLELLNAEEFGQVFITDKDHQHLIKIMSDLKFTFKHTYLS
jgi:DNA replication and repair protein RecF